MCGLTKFENRLKNEAAAESVKTRTTGESCLQNGTIAIKVWGDPLSPLTPPGCGKSITPMEKASGTSLRTNLPIQHRQ